MPVIRKSIDINASLEKVFTILDDPERIQEYGVGVTRVSDFNQTPQRVGDTGRITYSALGLRFPMKFTVTAHEHNAKISLSMEGGMTGTMNWEVTPQGSGTAAAVTIDYRMRGGILGKAFDVLLVERMNDRNATRMMENLKMISEA